MTPSRDSLALGLTVAAGLFLVLFLGAQFLVLETEQRVSEHYARQSAANAGSEPVPERCIRAPAHLFARCMFEQYEVRPEWEYETRNLHAQESIALSTFWMLVATVSAFFAILGTLYFTGITARQSIIMAEQARLSTEAARAAVQVTREMGEIQTRAYLTATAASIIQTPGQPDRLEVAVRNSGQSPAYAVSLIYAESRPEQGLRGASGSSGHSVRIYPEFGVIAAGGREAFSINLGFVAEGPGRVPGVEGGARVLDALIEYQTIFQKGSKRFDRETAFTLTPDSGGPDSGTQRMKIWTNFECDWIDWYRADKARGEEQGG